MKRDEIFGQLPEDRFSKVRKYSNRKMPDNLPIYKGVVDASLLAGILIRKYEYHMPFYRQIRQFSQLGLNGLTESTVDNWFKQTVKLLKPLYEALKEEIFKADYMQADETVMPVINSEAHKASKEYLRMIRAVMDKRLSSIITMVPELEL